MSKVKKKSIYQQTSLSEIDVRLEKIINILGLIFFIISITVLGTILLFDFFDIAEMEISLTRISFAFMIFTGVSSALSFGLSSLMKKQRDKKRSIFLDWLLSELLLCFFAICTIGAYQW